MRTARTFIIVAALASLSGPAFAQDTSRPAAQAFTGGGVALLTTGESSLPMLSFRYLRQDRGGLLPEITVSGIPPFFFAADAYLGLALPISRSGSLLTLSAGPSVLTLIGGSGYGGAVVGYGANAGILFAGLGGVGVHLTAGPRVFGEGNEPVLLIGVEIVGRRGGCACAAGGR